MKDLLQPDDCLMPAPGEPIYRLETWVYFIQEEPDGAIKIGRTDVDPEARVSACQTGNPRKLVLRNVIQADSTFEGRLHKRFKDAHIRGEWFAPTPELLAFMANPTWDDEAERLAAVRASDYACECGTDIGIGGQTKCWDCDPDQWEAAA